MSKFKIKLKLQGLELEIEGSREDIPSIAQNLGQQLTGLIQPSSAIVEGGVLTPNAGQQSTLTINNSDSDVPNNKKQRRRKRTGNDSQGHSAEASSLEWKHDPAKYGNPKQEWSGAQKAIWLMYVVLQENSTTQLTASKIANTFNKKFRQSGTISPSNVSRDLGNLKTKTPSPVQDDTTKSISEWFLTDAGIKRAQDTIKETLSAVS